MCVCSPPGSCLKQCGAVEVKLGQAMLQYHSRMQMEFITPLKAFLEVDIKNVLVRKGGRERERGRRRG